MLASNLVQALDQAGLDPVAEHGAARLATTELRDVVHDSRQVQPDTLFCAVPGQTVDGHRFVVEAVAAGATALLVDRPVDPDVIQLRVPDVRRAMAHAAGAVHGHPSAALDVFGITGTNGKTTTTQLLAAIAAHAGRSTDVVGTLTGTHTTPESTDLQRHLRAACSAGVEVVALEISSHALDQYRVESIELSVAAFSNLSPEHLDYHGDMESYFAAKAALFDGRSRHELINVDDPWGRRLADRRPEAIEVSAAALTVEDFDLSGSRVRWRGEDLFVPLPGQMNIANAQMAAEAALLLGIDQSTIVAGLADVGPIPGRMETVTVDDPAAPTVVVDYSHTPESIELALATIADTAHPTAMITIVFGCGGDRDRAKRPLMGRAAELGADRVVITSDNPRSEDPDAIIAQARAGLVDPASAIVEPDRRAAIATALELSGPTDVVLVAGKGHERTQTLADRTIDFDDVAVSLSLLKELFS